ncbi:MAG: hypothetical protein KKA52_07145 [Candidatus Omnitrophica bacterium]|nr:hypothetical protein [Candidatus Omnitrophota bacterium]
MKKTLENVVLLGFIVSALVLSSLNTLSPKAIAEGNNVVTGEIIAVDLEKASFTVQALGETAEEQTVLLTDETTAIETAGGALSLSDLVSGMFVEAEYEQAADGTLKAKYVVVE